MPNQLLDDYSFEKNQLSLFQKEKDLRYLKIYTLFFMLSCCLSIVYIRLNCMSLILDIAPNLENNRNDFLKIMLLGLLYLQVFLLAKIIVIFLFINSFWIILLKQIQRIFQTVKNESHKLFFVVQQVLKFTTYLILFLSLVLTPSYLLLLFLVRWLVTIVLVFFGHLIQLIFGITLGVATYYTDIAFFTVLTMVVGSFLILYLFLKEQIKAY